MSFPSYSIANGGTFKMIPAENPVKVGMNLTLKNSQGDTKSFYHEIDSIDVDVINQACAELAVQFENESSVIPPDPAIVFNTDIPVDPASF